MAEQLTEQSFQEKVLKEKGLVLVDFFATWCGPCQMLAPVIAELSKEYEGKASIYKLDVDENSSVAQKYNVMSIPTLIYFKNGEKIKQIIGVESKDEIKQFLDANL